MRTQLLNDDSYFSAKINVIILFFHLLLFILFIVLFVSKIHLLLNLNINDGDVCLVDYAITHTILRNTIYFINLKSTNTNVSTIYLIPQT